LKEDLKPGMVKPIGPYSPARAAGEWLFVSGQIALDESGQLVQGTAARQAEICLRHLGARLREAGFSPADVVKTTVFLADMGSFAEVNEVYAKFFAPPYPARSAVAVVALPKGAAVEIEAVARR
jgi:2-iminobutanoate/2-iminopropanoate deaminase